MIAWFQKNMYLAIGIGILILLLGISARVNLSQSAKIGTLKAETKTLTNERDQVKLDLSAKTQVADALRTSLDQALETIRIGTQTQDKAAAAWKQEYLRVTQEAAVLRRKLDGIYSSTASCQSLADLDIAAACPLAAASLRERARKMSAP